MDTDRYGNSVRPTQATRVLRKVKKTITIDSRDRDTLKFVRVVGGASVSDPGDFVVYLPRVYENVVSIRLKSAIMIAPQTNNWTLSNMYILLDIQGLNKIDETAAGADRAGFVDNVFAKIPITGANTATILYCDNTYEENITHYSPPIGRLDRFHITTRYHQSLSSVGLTTPNGAPITFGTSEMSFTFELEYLDNGFDDFSTFETAVRR